MQALREAWSHLSGMSPDAKPPAQVHAMSADRDNASVASDASNVIILTQKMERSSIPPNHLLIDSQSTTNLFSNPEHVNNVHPAAHPINVHCNKGVIATSTVLILAPMKCTSTKTRSPTTCHFFSLANSITSLMTLMIAGVYPRPIHLVALLNSNQLHMASMLLTSMIIPTQLIFSSPPLTPTRPICMSTQSMRITKVSPQNKSSGPTRCIVLC
jgi:hypothetical protein